MELAFRIQNKLRRAITPTIAKLRGSAKVAIVGAGGIAPTHINAYQESGVATVVSVSDISCSALARTLDRFPSVKAYLDCERMLNDIKPDVISICTWPQSHLQIVEMAAASGVRGILCEKPLALEMAEVRRMNEICQQHRVKLAGGHQYRFHPNFVQAKELIASGKVGRIHTVRAEIKSSLANNGPHLFDTVRYLLNDRDAITASCNCVRTTDAFDRGFAVEDGASGCIEFKDEIKVNFATGDSTQAFFEIEVVGDHGKLLVMPSKLQLNDRIVAKQSGSTQHLYRRRQFAQFVNWVYDKVGTYPADGVQSGKSAELVLALYEAARTGEPTVLPLKNQGNTLCELYPNESFSTAAAADVSKYPEDSTLAINGGPRSLTSWYPSKPFIGRDEILGVTKVLLSGQLNSVGGTAVSAFEKMVAKDYGTTDAVASTSGTASIHVALGCLGLEPGDEVITTPITDMGTIIPILWCNSVPVFADIDPRTGNITADTVAAQITEKTRAVVLVHLFGRPADVKGIKSLLDERGIALVEDCSQAHYATLDGQKVGTFGDFGCFSLQQAKQITCGDGGFTLVNRDEFVHPARLFVDKGWNRRSGTRAHELLGMNYRMTEMQGAVAQAQFKKLGGLIQTRRTFARMLVDGLRQIDGIELPTELPGADPSWWIFNFCINEDNMGIGSDQFAELLQTEGFRARRNYLPRPIFGEDVIQKRLTYGNSKFPFSISNREPPDVANMPGLNEFMQKQMVVTWGSRITEKHVDGMIRAVAKVAKAIAGA